mmetsp:Transcript_4845/g.4593  ORF Transcript_4845/g.4593 Transcript_4845/m.4593 type:complete len:133 (+) Transcript_4845:2152-2550(+)
MIRSAQLRARAQSLYPGTTSACYKSQEPTLTRQRVTSICPYSDTNKSKVQPKKNHKPVYISKRDISDGILSSNGNKFSSKMPMVFKKAHKAQENTPQLENIGPKILNIGGMNNWTNRSIDLYSQGNYSKHNF